MLNDETKIQEMFESDAPIVQPEKLDLISRQFKKVTGRTPHENISQVARKLFYTWDNRKHGLTYKMVLDVAPKCNGRPVMVGPGFMTSDITMFPIAKFLKHVDCRVFPSGYGINTGFHPEKMKALGQRGIDIRDEYDMDIGLFGYSLGGTLFREYSRELPEITHSILSAGSPFAKVDDKRNTPFSLREGVHKVFNLEMSRLLKDPDVIDRLGTPPPVWTVSAMSKADGIVDHHASYNPPQSEVDTPVESHHVPTTHLGMLFSPHIWLIAAHTFSQPDDWSKRVKFDPKIYGLEKYFPKPVPDELLRPNPRWDMSRAGKMPTFRPDNFKP